MEVLAIFKETDTIRGHQMVMRTKLIHRVDLHLRLYNMQLSDCPFRHQIDQVAQRIVLNFLFLKGLVYNASPQRTLLGAWRMHLLTFANERWIRRFKDHGLSCKDGK
jgi:hypothetical protein